MHAPKKHPNGTFRLEVNADLYDGVRYAFLNVSEEASAFTVTEFRRVCQVVPLTYFGSFISSDSLLNKIWYVGAYTVRVTAIGNGLSPGGFLGSELMNRGDRIAFLGDAHVAQATFLAAFAGKDPASGGRVLLRQSNAHCGSIGNFIQPYNIMFVLSVLDLFDWTGNATDLESLSSTCEDRLRHARDVLLPAAVNSTRSASLDWSRDDPRMGFGFESPNVPEAQRAYSALCVEAFSRWGAAQRHAGNTSAADEWEAAAMAARQKIGKPIGAWDTSKVADMWSMFDGFNHRFNQALGKWDTSKVTDMRRMFQQTAFNQPIGKWDTSEVIDMSYMFYLAATFDQPIGEWDTSKVTDMNSMFQQTAFNQPIGKWDTTKVTDMNGMFERAAVFNHPIGKWGTSEVIDMRNMFYYAAAFNQPIGAWNTSKVANMGVPKWKYGTGMFCDAAAFNQPLGKWDTSKVTNMHSMFRDADAFNQPIGKWDTSEVTDMTYIFQKAAAFNQPLGAWDINNLLPTGKHDMFGFTNVPETCNRPGQPRCTTMAGVPTAAPTSSPTVVPNCMGTRAEVTWCAMYTDASECRSSNDCRWGSAAPTAPPVSSPTAPTSGVPTAAPTSSPTVVPNCMGTRAEVTWCAMYTDASECRSSNDCRWGSAAPTAPPVSSPTAPAFAPGSLGPANGATCSSAGCRDAGPCCCMYCSSSCSQFNSPDDTGLECGGCTSGLCKPGAPGFVAFTPTPAASSSSSSLGIGLILVIILVISAALAAAICYFTKCCKCCEDKPSGTPRSAKVEMVPVATMMQVQVPPGFGPGTVLQLQAPNGVIFQVAIPAGVPSGSFFNVPVPQPQQVVVPASQPAVTI